MIQKIGKYQIIERIGRGGMGTVYKAHDPVLDRTVAIKVISADVDVSDELRARLFREAQACARLSHPNIVTLYDLADVEGRLFIVMEFLEGEELKQLIAERRPMSLEDQLALMIQICDGLGYAHRQGIVHRDIKPGNILVLRDGGVKILDFGVARIMSSESGLTRTGLVVGTLRYMAPEQARGRADQRSDIFSLGAVFYEFLGHRPAFPGEDPIQILEALRSHEPGPLTELDSSIPPDLAAAIARTLRKDPAERPTDVEELRRQLDSLRRGLVEEANRLRARLRLQIEEAQRVRAAVAARVGGAVDDETPPVVDRASGLVALRAIERDLARRVQRLQEILERAGVLEPAVQRGLALLEAGDLEAGVQHLEAIVGALPEHARAAEALQRARSALEDRRRSEQWRRALDHAHAALEQGDDAECLDRLQGLEDAEVTPDLRSELGRLREAAGAARAARIVEEQRREAALRERERAGRGQDEARRARQAAEDLGAAQEAPAAWRAAEVRWGEGRTAFETEDYAAAAAAFAAALDRYRSAEGEARDARRHRAQAEARAAQTGAVRGREAAAALDAAECSGDVWSGAVAAEAQAEAALERQELATALALFAEATRAYERAAEAAQQERHRRERDAAVRAREPMEQLREVATRTGAAEQARGSWGEAEARREAGERALGDEDYRQATEYFEQALDLYRRAAAENRIQPAPAEVTITPDPADADMVLVGDSTRVGADDDATQVVPPDDARKDATHVLPTSPGKEAEPDPPRGRVPPWARRRRRWPVAAGLGGLGLAAVAIVYFLWSPAPPSPPPVVDARAAEKSLSERLKNEVATARKAAETADAPRLAAAAFGSAAEREARADVALAAGALAQARVEYAEALKAYEGAATAAHEAAALARQKALDEEKATAALKQKIDDAEAARGGAAGARRSAEAAGARRYAARSFGVGEDHDQQGRLALGQKSYDDAAARFRNAQRAYQAAVKETETAIAAQSRQQADAERLHEQAIGARRAAEQAGAERHAASLMRAGRNKEREGDAAMKQQEYGRATTLFRDADTDFRAALQDAQREAAQRETEAAQPRQAGVKQEIDQLRAAVAARRGEAAKAEAEVLARELFDAANAQEKEGDRLVASLSLPEARRAYQDASSRYEAATARAREIAPARSDADRTRARMQGEKQGARPESPDFAAALEQEKNGNALYARASFPEAAERFRAAAYLFAKAKLPPPSQERIAPFGPDESTRIKAVLDDFKRAIESKDLALLRRVRPGLAGDELRRLRDTFDNTAGYTLDLKVQTIQIQGDVAYARAYRRDTFRAKDGQIYREETDARFTLKRTQDRWTIEGIEAVK